MSGEQFGRKATLMVVEGEQALDLSALRFTFSVKAQDVESPNNAAIRIYNLSDVTVAKIRGEFSRVVLQAGYENNFGVIFDGTIKQVRIGREGPTDTYLDLLAADGDIAYNLAMVNKTMAAGSTSNERIQVAVDAMKDKGVTGSQVLLPETGGVLPRGKVLFGMARAALRAESQNQGASWFINQGQVQVVKNDGYLPSQAVVLNGQTGLIGRPEQTIDGIRARCLINPQLAVGGRVKIDNEVINQTLQKNAGNPPVAYDRWVGLQLFANIAADGLYRIYVIEYEGDTRGGPWYCDLTLLAIDSSTSKVVSP